MRSFHAHTLALLVVFMATGVLDERLVAGMDWGEAARGARSIRPAPSRAASKRSAPAPVVPAQGPGA